MTESNWVPTEAHIESAIALFDSLRKVAREMRPEFKHVGLNVVASGYNTGLRRLGMYPQAVTAELVRRGWALAARKGGPTLFRPEDAPKNTAETMLAEAFKRAGLTAGPEVKAA